MAGAGADGLVTGLQSAAATAGFAIGEAEAELRRAASARLLRMAEMEGILRVCGKSCRYRINLHVCLGSFVFVFVFCGTGLEDVEAEIYNRSKRTNVTALLRYRCRK